MRFKKVILDPDGHSVYKIIDNKTGEEVFTIKGDDIINLAKTTGEQNARNTLAGLIRDIYPDLTAEEIQEIFS